MDTLEAIRTRRAVKHYDPEHQMTEAEITELFDLAIQSPSSFNMQNWRFVAVTDPAQKAKLREAAFDQAQVTDASVAIVMCADLKAWAKNPEQYWVNAPQPVQDLLVPWMGQFYEGNDQVQRDEAMRSTGIAAQTIMLAAKAMGYDSCPMIGIEPDKIAPIINLPEDHVICMMVVVGKKVKDAWPKPGQLPLKSVLIRDSF